MLTTKENAKLKRLIRAFADTTRQDEMKGSLDVEDADMITIRYKRVKKRLYDYINELTEPEEAVCDPHI